MKFSYLIVCLLGCGLMGSSLSAQELTLHLEPEADARVVATVMPDDPRLTDSALLLDRPVEDGWYRAIFDGVVEGFVPESEIGKGLLPVEGTPLHAEADADSAVLTTVSAEDLDEDRIQILDEGLWWMVRIDKPIPVYYREPVITAEAAPAEEPREQVRPAPVARPAPEPTAEPEIEETESRASPNFVAGSLGTHVRGTLERTKPRLFFLSPPYPFQLKDQNGRRAAYVDFTEAILQKPVSSYLGQEVSVFGPWEKLPNSREVVVRARNMRPVMLN